MPNVNPVYTWVRLAQRVPVRIRITHVPASVPLVSGMTVTVTIRGAEARESGAYRDPIIGQVQTVTRGISVANAAPISFASARSPIQICAILVSSK